MRRAARVAAHSIGRAVAATKYPCSWPPRAGRTRSRRLVAGLRSRDGCRGEGVPQPCEAFVPAERRKYIEDPGETARPVSAARSGWATAPSRRSSASASLRTAVSSAAASQGVTAASAAANRDKRSPAGASSFAPPGSGTIGRDATRNTALSDSSIRSFVRLVISGSSFRTRRRCSSPSGPPAAAVSAGSIRSRSRSGSADCR